MKAILPEELNVIQLDILDDIHQFCVNNNIRYSLAFGSLIGAIRHHGYIPWDDDIDIMMPRPDYDVFINSFNGAYNHLVVAAPELDWNYYAPYANVYDNRTLLLEGANGHRGLELGIKIDVFPIDGTPESNTDYEQLRHTIWHLNGVLYAKRRRLKLDKRSLPYIKTRIKYCYKSYVRLQKEIARLLASHPYPTSSFVDELAFNPYLNSSSRVPASVFDKYINVSFEDRHYLVISAYDSFLSNVYGDYMKLPPKEKRIPHHGFTAFWK